jgi:NAD(P)-dependent dehydrogenase (short-subunit alcohol dehydrogenase family)
MGRLDGKVAVVTGGASGMGLATVERFVAEGASVVIVDLPAGPATHEGLVERLGADQAAVHYKDRAAGGPHDGAAIAERLGPGARFVAADVTDAEQFAEAFAVADREFGGLDILFGNAGVGGAEGTVANCPEALFDRIIAVDLKAVWLGIKLATPHLLARGRGSIISTSSGAGLMGIPGLAAYSAAKGGVIALTRAAAMELASAQVRVNCICPGGIVTPIIHDSPLTGASMDPDTLRAVLAMAHPIPRAGEGEDIANAALWLASDESSFVTGQAIAVDGGLSAEADARMRGQVPTANLGGRS